MAATPDMQAFDTKVAAPAGKPDNSAIRPAKDFSRSGESSPGMNGPFPQRPSSIETLPLAVAMTRPVRPSPGTAFNGSMTFATASAASISALLYSGPKRLSREA